MIILKWPGRKFMEGDEWGDACRKVAEDKTEEKVCSAGVQTEMSEV